MEIGFGNGASLAEMAAASPETNFFGIEVHRPGVGSLLVHVLHQGIENVRVSADDAVQVLNQQIPDQSLDRVQIFFPDPWHKKRHHKRPGMDEISTLNPKKKTRRADSTITSTTSEATTAKAMATATVAATATTETNTQTVMGTT